MKGDENKVQSRVFRRGRGESEVSIKVSSVKYLWVKSCFWWYQRAQWHILWITFPTHREAKTSVSGKQKSTKPLLCWNFPQKLHTIHWQNQKQLDDHVITASDVRREMKKQTAVCTLMNRNSYLTTDWERVLALLRSYIPPGMRVIRCHFPTGKNGQSSYQQMDISVAVFQNL